MVQVEGRMTLCVNRFARKAVSRMTEAPSVTPSRNRMMLVGRLCYRPVKATRCYLLATGGGPTRVLA